MARHLLRLQDDGTIVLEDTGNCPFALGPLLARSVMGDYRMACIKQPLTLYYALGDALATGGSGWQAGDIFIFMETHIFTVHVNPKKGNELVLSVETENWRRLFKERAFWDGALRGVPGTALAFEKDINQEEPFDDHG